MAAGREKNNVEINRDDKGVFEKMIGNSKATKTISYLKGK